MPREGPLAKDFCPLHACGLRKQAHLKKCDEEVCREEVQPEASDYTY